MDLLALLESIDVYDTVLRQHATTNELGLALLYFANCKNLGGVSRFPEAGRPGCRSPTRSLATIVIGNPSSSARIAYRHTAPRGEDSV